MDLDVDRKRLRTAQEQFNQMLGSTCKQARQIVGEFETILPDMFGQIISAGSETEMMYAVSGHQEA